MSAKTRRTQGEDARTRDRLLEAAGATFAEQGFRVTTIREVCKRAHGNLASVNYHFGSKKDLYLAALRQALEAAKATASPRPETSPNPADAPRFLETFVRSTVARILAPRPGWHQQLLQREFVEPTFALDVVVKEYIRPHFHVLREGLRPLLPGATEREVDLHALSVIGQIVYYRAAAPVAQRLLGQRSLDARFCDELAEHVVRFSTRALGVRS